LSRTRGSDAAQTRERILAVAMDSFRDQGFNGTSIRGLAQGAGMATAALYYHFAGKEEILRALMAPFLADLRSFADTPSARSGDPAAILTGLAEVLLRHGGAIEAVMNDISAMRHIIADGQFPQLVAGIERLLAGSDDPLALLRARCAFGALEKGVVTLIADREQVCRAAVVPDQAAVVPERAAVAPDQAAVAPDQAAVVPERAAVAADRVARPGREHLGVVVAAALAALRSRPLGLDEIGPDEVGRVSGRSCVAWVRGSGPPGSRSRR